MSAAIQPIYNAVGKHGFKKAQAKAGKHYQEHEAAYQEQALKEAGEDGYKPRGWKQ